MLFKDYCMSEILLKEGSVEYQVTQGSEIYWRRPVQNSGNVGAMATEKRRPWGGIKPSLEVSLKDIL